MTLFANAPCLGATDVFFPEDEDYEKAKAVCSTCKYKDPCGEGALNRQEEFGCYGGMSPDERFEIIAYRRSEVRKGI